MNDRFTELLPWYVNGTIDPSDRAWVDAQLRAHPEAAAELCWYESLQVRIRENEPQVSADIGIDKAFAKIRREQEGEQRIAAARKAQEPSLGDRVKSWLAGFGLTPALTAAAAVIAIQGVFLFNMARDADSPHSEIRSSQSGIAAAGTMLKLNFKPDAREAEIRMLLIDIHGSLVGGPGQLGDYFIVVPKDRADVAETKLKTSTLVEAAVVVPGLPARD